MSALGQMNSSLSNCSSCLWNVLIHCWVNRVVAAIESRSRWVATYRHTRTLTHHFGYNNMSIARVQRKSRGTAFDILVHTCLLGLLKKLLSLFLETPTLWLVDHSAQDCNQLFTEKWVENGKPRIASTVVAWKWGVQASTNAQEPQWLLEDSQL